MVVMVINVIFRDCIHDFRIMFQFNSDFAGKLVLPVSCCLSNCYCCCYLEEAFLVKCYGNVNYD